MPTITKNRLHDQHLKTAEAFPYPEQRHQIHNVESQEMWKAHVGSSNGVVIESSPELITRHLAYHKHSHIGLVRYIDFEREDLGSYLGSQAVERAFLKRQAFSLEKELRIVTMNLVVPGCLNEDGTPPTLRQLSGPGTFSPGRPGLFVRARVGHLVRSVRLAPGAGEPFVSEVQQATAHLGLQVERSSLEAST